MAAPGAAEPVTVTEAGRDPQPALPAVLPTVRGAEQRGVLLRAAPAGPR